jgi:hypothetical protein
MGFRNSTGLRTHLMRGGSFQQAFQNGALLIYSGTQPASADDAPSGTLLCTITSASGTRTAEVRASATVTIAGSSGSVDNVKVTAAAIDLLQPNQFSAAVPVTFSSDLTTTAANVALQINKGTWWHGYEATSAAAVVTVKPLPGLGDSINAADITATCTTLTTTDVDFANGVDAANGILFGTTASGTIGMSGTWSGVNAASGTAGWARFVGSIADAGASSTTLPRCDMDIATAGSIMTMSSTTMTSGATTTISSVSISWPAS